MKLRFTTKSFIFSFILYIAFRTLQIIFLTTAETSFLKPQYLWLNILLTVLCLLPIAYTVANAYYAFKCPNCVGRTGVLGSLVGLFSGILLLIPVAQELFSKRPSLITVFFLALGVISCFLLAGSELFGFCLHKASFLPILLSSLFNLINAYAIYTSHPLRARTIYEILAISLSVIFFLYLSKAHCLVKQEKSFRLLYPLGFLTAIFCFTATLPELISYLLGYGQNLSAGSCSPFTLLGIGVFTTYITLSSNTNKNTSK